VKQVAEEYQEILNAPPIAYGVSIPTCHFCGRILKHEEATPVTGVIHRENEMHPSMLDKIPGTQRFRGRCCGG
jgi:creatinine amidohydrolase/Fe(II)-dependent formamide hydrolase-like protein